MRVIEAVSITAELDPYFSLRGLAGYTSLSRRTLQDLVNDTRDPLPSYRLGGKILVRKSDFDRWMTRRRNQKPLEAARLAAADAQALLSSRPRKNQQTGGSEAGGRKGWGTRSA
ncbi:MAG TPA: helix-turn-helix domain-containing protein [Candidatus Acidoferrum sp.]|nr:helix-turn-helix domain-containing protein [Candidatus Acidoferrum sp.]